MAAPAPPGPPTLPPSGTEMLVGKAGLGERWCGERARGGRGLLITLTDEEGEAERGGTEVKEGDGRGLTLRLAAWPLVVPDGELATNDPLWLPLRRLDPRPAVTVTGSLNSTALQLLPAPASAAECPLLLVRPLLLPCAEGAKEV